MTAPTSSDATARPPRLVTNPLSAQTEKPQQNGDVLVLASDQVSEDRAEVLRWARKMNGKQHERAKVGGVVLLTMEATTRSLASQSSGEDSPSPTWRFRASDAARIRDKAPLRRKCLRSLTSGEVRWLPSEEALDYDLEDIYEWAREEIMCAFEAGVDVLILDELGPEVIHGEALDSALRACLWKANEDNVQTKFLLFVEPSVMTHLPQLYNILPVEMDSFKAAKEFLKAAVYNNHRHIWHRKARNMADSVDEAEDTIDNLPLDLEGHHGTGPFYTIAKFPLLIFTVGIIFLELAMYIMVRQLVNFFEMIFRRNREEYYQLTKATSYSTWRRSARQMDVKEGKSSGSLDHVPTLKHHLRALRRATRHLAIEMGAVGQNRPSLDDDETASVTSTNSATNMMEEKEAEHEILGVLRASATSLNELANEQIYALNHMGTNLEMRQLVTTFLDALDEVDACENPELLHFKHYAKIKRKFTSGGERLRRASMAEFAERAIGGLQARASQWTSPMRATLSRINNSPTNGGGSLLARWTSQDHEKANGGNPSPQSSAKTSSNLSDKVRPPVHPADGNGKPLAQNPITMHRRPSQHRLHRPLLEEDDEDEDEDTEADKEYGDTTSEGISEASPERTVADPETDEGKLQSAFWESKRRFFSELAHTYGETALCLSGGAGNAFYHLGVVKTLVDRDMLPEYITGASGGALVGSYVCTRTDEELREQMRPEVLCKVFNPCSVGYYSMFLNLMKKGNIFETTDWIPKLVKQVCGDLTFREAYERSHKALIIPVYNIDEKGKQHTRVLCHRTTPDVVIYSAVLASSAIPRLLPPIELLRKDARGHITPYHSFGRFWRDGSFQNELPFDALRQLFNVTFTIVSQVEPHLSPFFYSHRGSAGKPVAHGRGKGWRGGFALSYVERLLKLDLRKWLELVRDFSLMPRVMSVDASSVFLGNTRGTVTLVPPIRMWSYVHLVADPDTPRTMGVYLRTGARMTWPALAMLRDRLEIERRLAILAEGPDEMSPLPLESPENSRK